MGGGWRVVVSAVGFALLLGGEAEARRDAAALATPGANALLAPVETIGLPGRGLALSWSPDGSRLAVGGHFRDKLTGLRYDTRIADLASATLTKSFACHYFWVVATAWTQNPFVGEVIADGGGDHAVKVWNAGGPGSTRCNPGQFLTADGGLRKLGEIPHWTTALAFSPDGRFLAGAARDGSIRLWQVEPGPQQWKVVRLWYDAGAGNFLSVVWHPSGRLLATGDRSGRIAVWPFDPARDRWDAATVTRFAGVSYEAQASWYRQNAGLVTRTPLWSEGGHGQVWNVRFAPWGFRVAAAGIDGLVSVYATATGRVLYRTGAAVATAFHGLDWSPDGRFLAAGGADRRVHVFNAWTGARADRLEGHADVVAAVAWSPDGRLLASTAGGPRLSAALLEAVTGPDQTIRLWAWR